MRNKFRYGLLLVFSILGYAQVFSQTLYGTVVDENSEVLVRAHIQDTVFKSKTITDNYGNFQIEFKESSVLKVSMVGYKTKYLLLKQIEDSSRLYIELRPKTEQLEEVIVTSERLKSVVIKTNTSVLDFIPYKNFVLALKKYGSEYYISLEGTDTTYREFAVSGLKPKSLFEDCYGNVHLLSRDSSFQIWIDSGLQVVDQAPIETFAKMLKPCIGKWEGKYTFYTFSNHKKKYTLYSIPGEASKVNHFFSVWDKKAEIVANREYWGIISYYYRYASEEENIIANGMWDGNLIALQLPGHPELNQMITWYLKIRGKEIKVCSFQKGEEIITVDYLNDSLYTFNYKGKQLNCVEFEHPTEWIAQILVDKANYNFYALTVHNGKQSLFSINTESGKTQRIFTLEETSFAEGVQVFNDYIYFTKAQSGYHKLFRIKLNSIKTNG